jgi:transcriptional regulator with XRE-family HTH domain
MTDVVVPDWDLADRLIKARRHAGLSRPALAAWMGISRNSMSHYETGKTVPPPPVLRLWAQHCGVSLGWLRHGDTDGEDQSSTRWLTTPAPAVNPQEAA